MANPPESEAAPAKQNAEGIAASVTVTGLIEQVGRDTGTRVLREAQLAASHHAAGLRRAAGKGALAIGTAVALITALALANWAIVNALYPSLPGWRAPLVLAAGWLALSVVLAAAVLPRRAWTPRRGRVGSEAETIRQRQHALEQAAQTMRDTLEQLTAAIADAAEARIAAAILPLAGGMVVVGEEMVDATDEVIEAADEITDALEDEIPGGHIINRAVDITLLPGRLGIRIVKTALERVGTDH